MIRTRSSHIVSWRLSGIRALSLESLRLSCLLPLVPMLMVPLGPRLLRLCAVLTRSGRLVCLRWGRWVVAVGIVVPVGVVRRRRVVGVRVGRGVVVRERKGRGAVLGPLVLQVSEGQIVIIARWMALASPDTARGRKTHRRRQKPHNRRRTTTPTATPIPIPIRAPYPRPLRSHRYTRPVVSGVRQC